MTKGILLFLMFSFVLTGRAEAQHYAGVIGGLNLSRISIPQDDLDPQDELRSLTRFGVGGVLGIQLNESLTLHFEPMYLQKGGIVFDTIDNQEIRYQANMIEIPAFLKVALNTQGVRPYLMAGPAVGFRVSSNIEVDADGVTFEGDINDVTESIDFSAVFAGGISVPVGANAFFVEGRYALGLANQNKGGEVTLRYQDIETVEILEPVDVKTRGFQVMAGVTFNFGN